MAGTRNGNGVNGALFDESKRLVLKRPKPTVEVGQVWRSDNFYEFPNQKCQIIGVDDESVAFKFKDIFKIRNPRRTGINTFKNRRKEPRPQTKFLVVKSLKQTPS